MVLIQEVNEEPADQTIQILEKQLAEARQRVQELERRLSEARNAKPKAKCEPAAGFRRMEIVEASDDEDDEPTPASTPAEPFSDLRVEYTLQGVEQAKQKANTLFAEGKTSDAERWFSKALWVAEESGKVKEVPETLRSQLHSNRAFARLKLQQWPGAEDDCTKALTINSGNFKALYRRAQARFELKNRKGALDDVEKLLPELAKAKASDKEALELREKILALPSGQKEPPKQEAEAKRNSPKAEMPKPKSPSAPAPGFRRMEIVEASDDEEDEPVPATGTAEPFPDLKVEFTVTSLEEAKQKANTLFAEGKTSDAERWFSKAIWVAEESGKMKEVPENLRSVLHSNRAFARLKLKQWPGVEDDCTKALSLNTGNAKALYRRAQARFELKQRQGALDDVEKLLPLLAPPSDKEAQELREKILALPAEGEPPKKATAEPPKTSSPKAAAPMPNGSSEPEPAPGFRRIEIVEASDDEDDEPAPVSNGSDSPKAKAPAEPYPDLHIEFTAAGLEKAKQQANGLFSAGNTSESERWFSKALWVAQESGQVKEVPDSLRAVLYSNRAFARLKMKNWPGVEEDCTKALALSSNNAKALYRRAQARFELKQRKGALEDVEKLLPLLASPSDKDALELRDKILALPSEEGEPKKAEAPKPSSPKAEAPKPSSPKAEAPKPSSPKADPPKSSSPKAPPAAGFRRMEIVEASDDEDEELAPAKTATGPAEPHADLRVEFTVQGVEKAKQQANTLFSEGKTSDAERWFSKAIWVAEESGKVKEVPDSLRSVLHTNRAFARLKLKQWPGVEDDCTKALSLSASNAKALYRRAQARFELKQRQEALEDVEKLLPLLGPPSDKEALELREKILALPTQTTEPAKKAAPASPKEASEPPPGFKRMQIVEASDSEEEAEPAKMSNGHGGEPLSPSKPATTSPAARDPPPGFRRLQIQEASDDEEPAPPKMSNGVSTPNGFAPPSPAKAEAKAAAERKAAETEVKKMPPEPYPEIKLEHTVAGAEKAKEEGNRLFAAGSIEESARWFSKAIWLVEESGYVTGVTATLRAILHSNRAFARLKMRQWTDAEVDCSQALTFNSSNPKALYRRAMARKELQKYDAALADVEALLPMLDQAPSKDALDLREELLRLTAPSKEVPKAEKAAPKEPAQKPPSPAGAASRAPAPAALASLPAASPKSSMEMLRQLKSLKRNPTVMTQYVSERVPPALLQSLFSKSPIEADDLALVLQCLRTAAAADTPMPPATVGEYLQQLLRTNAAETQFSMLSTSEKQIVRELITLAPSGDQVELEKRFKRVLS